MCQVGSWEQLEARGRDPEGYLEDRVFCSREAAPGSGWEVEA